MVTSTFQRPPRILFVDAYDSFSNSIVGLLESTINAEVTVVRIDNAAAAKLLKSILRSFDAVVVGPGPGNPSNPEDVGLINQLWALSEEDIIPIFGICLGFQSLARAFGGEVSRLAVPHHGIVNKVWHGVHDIFEGVGNFEATRYHSLYVNLNPQTKAEDLVMREYWHPSPECPTLQPLAWTVDDGENGPVLMALKHTHKPFWGVQFHPESICTTAEGHKIIQNWWAKAQSWSISRQRTTKIDEKSALLQLQLHPKRFERPRMPLHSLLEAKFPFINPKQPVKMSSSSVPLNNVSVIEIIEAMGLEKSEIILLDSQGHHSGRFSILGIMTPGETFKLSYNVKNKRLKFGLHKGRKARFFVNSLDDIWELFQTVLDNHRPTNDSTDHNLPFWGGFMGYISYEAGLETLDISINSNPEHSAPDLNFAFIQRSIVVDHSDNTAFVQYLAPGLDPWVLQTMELLQRIAYNSLCSAINKVCGNNDEGSGEQQDLKKQQAIFEEGLKRAHIEKPEEMAYRSKVLDCQDALLKGDSYELCLTDETTISIPKTNNVFVDPWLLYKRLRKNNPAPFGAFLSLPGVTVVSSSPERFFQWTRQGHCQYRPIKGTVKKEPGVDLAAASVILNSSKERAENLMIVDLIRHDLSGVIGAENCSVPKLMQIEEYQTVFQLVSVIEGQIPQPVPFQTQINQKVNGNHLYFDNGRDTKPTHTTTPKGINVLKASIPPGSMTGAPKKRSCQILAELECRPRGVYSGVLGYMDVGGGGDFNVVIRTAVRKDKEWSHRPMKSSSDECIRESVPHDIWRVGAGGAVTIQSSDIGEFLEMETKLDSVLKTFLS